MDHYVNLTGWAEGLVSAGAGVTVFQRYYADAVVERNKVSYRFVSDIFGPKIRAWQHSWSLNRQIRALCQARVKSGTPTVVHLNGLLFPLHACLLRAILPPACPLIAQHHAERPWPRQTRFLQQWGLEAVDGFFFTNYELAESWVEQSGIRSLQNVYEVMETSSPFTYQDRRTARAITHMEGQPVILWTGGLSRRKDPLTVLNGFEQFLTAVPAARLYMAYLYDDLLPQVQARLAQSPKLSRAVTRLGPIPHAKIAAYYNSADFFVQGSRSEGCGIALLDAMACGVTPVVTDIPSFRTITANGSIGALWPIGDAEALARTLLNLTARPLAPLSQQSRRFFEENWRFDVLGRRAVAAYREILLKNKRL